MVAMAERVGKVAQIGGWGGGLGNSGNARIETFFFYYNCIPNPKRGVLAILVPPKKFPTQPNTIHPSIKL